MTERKRRKLLTVRFLHRTTLFLGSLCFGLAAFYYFGNAQGFLDTTQLLILSITAVVSIALVLVSFFSFVPSLVLTLRGSRHYLLPALLGAVFFVFGLFLAAVSRAIMILSIGS